MCEVSDQDAEPVAYSCYEAMAEAYAASVDEAPYNAYYERPAVVSLLPPLAGINVFDAGCGSGWYAAYLTDRGARVMAVDSSPKMVSFTRQRLGKSADVRVADLGQTLEFAADNSFDLVLCPLVMHYLKDWEAVFTEFGRILKPGGRLIFSTHHPTMDYQLFKVDSYFDTELVEDEWRVGKVRFYRRPLTAMIDALASTGFLVERILEPQPGEAFRDADPEGYQKLKTQPWFIVIRAKKLAD